MIGFQLLRGARAMFFLVLKGKAGGGLAVHGERLALLPSGGQQEATIGVL